MLIRNIDTLRETVKIGKSTPWLVFTPFVADAENFYLRYYLGAPLIDLLNRAMDNDASDRSDDLLRLLAVVQRTLGPMVYMLSVHEGSINFGDTGHTVHKTDSMLPANDTKVAKAFESAQHRGWQNLEALLAFLEENRAKYPEWRESRYCQSPQSTFFRGAEDFQDYGMIDICYSRLTYEKLLQLIRRVETTEVKDLVTKDVFDSLSGAVLSELEQELLNCIRPYIATRVAQLHTSKSTRIQRGEHNRPEYKPLIRPLYEDQDDNSNYYTQQLAYWQGKIVGLLDEMGVERAGALNFNGPDKRIFCDIG